MQEGRDDFGDQGGWCGWMERARSVRLACDGAVEAGEGQRRARRLGSSRGWGGPRAAGGATGSRRGGVVPFTFQKAPSGCCKVTQGFCSLCAADIRAGSSSAGPS